MECELNKLSETDIRTLPKFTILVMMGLPGSGKTTLCHTLPNILGDNYHVVHVCYDQVVEFQEEWSDEGSYGMWKSERAKVLLAAEGLIKDFLLDQKAVKNESEVNRFEQSKLVSSSSQKVCLENSNLQGLTKEEVMQEKTCTEQPVVSEKVLDGLNIQDRVALDTKDLFCENLPVYNGVGKYSTLNFSKVDILPIDNLIQDFKFVDRNELQNKMIVLCVDDNFYYHSMRKEWWNLAAKYGLAFCTLMVSCAMDLCIERVRKRTHLYPQLDNVNVSIDVIKRMSKRFELPDARLCQWEKYCSVLDTSDLKITCSKLPGLSLRRHYVLDETSLQTFGNIKKLLFHSLLDPAKPLLIGVNPECYVATPSLVHRVDLVLRKIVGRSDKSLKAMINKKRKDLLEDLKNGRLHIPNDLTDEEDDSKERLEKYVAGLIDV